MPANCILVIDAGSSGVHCLVTDLEGGIISLYYQKWDYQSPDDIAPLGKEFDPNVFWHIICVSIRQVLKKGNIRANDIVGVSATSQREGAVFLDKAGKELYAGPNVDLRALTEGMAIDSVSGNEIYAITGHLPSFLFVPAKLKWFEANRPGIYDRITTVLTINEWIIFRLCGEWVSEACGASELGLVDIRTRQWSDQLQDLLALPRGIYSRLVLAGSPVGKFTAMGSAETGISTGTTVVQGAPDTHCGLLSIGIKEKGQVGIILGWSAPSQMVTDVPVFDTETRIWTSCHLFTDRWILESNAGEAGSAYHWLKEMMFGSEESSPDGVYGLMDNLALEAPPGAEEVMAFLGPAAMDMSHLTLKFGGFFLPVPLGVANIKRAHLIRASLENICFALKANCLQLEVISGLKIRKVAIGGGLTKSQCLTRILSAVLDMPIFVSGISEVSGLGAAMCAAVGSGIYSSLEEAMSAMKPETKVIEPEPRVVLEYAGYYQRWLSAARRLDKLGKEIK